MWWEHCHSAERSSRAFASCLIHTGSSSPPLAWAVRLWTFYCGSRPASGRASIARCGPGTYRVPRQRWRSERPLASVHLGALQHQVCYRQGSSRAVRLRLSCVDRMGWDRTCGNQSARLPHRCLMSCLPVGTGRERTWSMRLGAACIEHACNTFEQIDAGRAPMRAGGEQRRASGTWRGGSRWEGSGTTSALESSSTRTLPSAHGLAGGSRPAAVRCGGASRTGGLRRSLALPGAAELMQSAQPTQLSRSWDTNFHALRSRFRDDRWTGQVSL